MGLTIAKKTPSKIMLGKTEVQKVFQGSQLVWQNKLVEGEDYERYDYIVGDGEAYFDFILHGSYGLIDFGNIKIIDSTAAHKGIFFNNVRNDGWLKMYLKYNSSGNFRFAWHGGGTDQAISIKNGSLIAKARNLGGSPAKYNGVVTNGSSTIGIQTGWYFTWSGNIPGQISAPNGIGISKIEYTNQESKQVLYTRFPIKLLKNCPGNLSLDKQNHIAGECGLIDSETGIFISNANTVGAFSVYNDPVYITGCKIQIPNRYSVNPATLIVTGRVNVSKLTSTAKDYGIAKISKDYILMGHYIIGEGVATYAVDSSTWGNGYADIKFTYDLGYAAHLTINSKALSPAENPPFGQIESAMLDLTDGVLEISKVYQKVYDTAATTSEHNYTAIKKDGRFALQDDFDGQIYYQE